MGYVLRTDKLSKTYYFAGVTEASFMGSFLFAPHVLGAMDFGDRETAEQALIDLNLSDDFTISEISSGTSANLKGGA